MVIYVEAFWAWGSLERACEYKLFDPTSTVHSKIFYNSTFLDWSSIRVARLVVLQKP